MRPRAGLAGLALSLAAGQADPAAGAGPVRIAALGDMPYGDAGRARFEALLGAVDAAGPDLVIHVGDTKGYGPCTDAALARARADLDALSAPAIYTPGDNEWTDCHLPRAGGHDPGARLAYLRAAWFDAPGASLGRAPVPLVRQGAEGYPENARLRLGGITVISAHVVGSRNGLDRPGGAAEARARAAAAVRWLRAGFAAARAQGAAGVVVAMHADLFGARYDAGAERWAAGSGFAEVGAALRAAAGAFGRPVLLIHGDGHEFGVSRPFPRGAPELTAVEVFGWPEMHAVEVIADPARAGVFSARPLRNPAPAE